MYHLIGYISIHLIIIPRFTFCYDDPVKQGFIIIAQKVTAKDMMHGAQFSVKEGNLSLLSVSRLKAP